MNTWLRRTVGTVGIAGGMLLLGAGAAHADDTALAPGALDDLFSPTGGPNNQSLQLQAHSDRIDTSTESTAAGNQRTTSTSFTTNRVNRRAVPNMLQGLPVSSLVPTDSLGLPRTTSSRLPNLPALPTDAVASSALPVAGQAPSLANTESSLSTLPLVGGLTDLSQLGLPGAGLPGTDALQTTSIADTSTAFPSVQKPSPRKARKAQTEALPMVGGLPVVGGLPLLRGGGLPVRGNLNPVDNVGLPVGGGLPGAGRGATEAGGLPVVGDALPLGGSDVLKSDSVTGVPVIGGVGPTPGVSTTAVANRLVPTTGALPQAASNLPLVTESAAYAPRHAESAAYAPRHSQTEALPVVTGLPVVGGVAQGVLPFFSGIAG